MSDSDARDRLDAKHERIDKQRIKAIKRWVSYIESNPPEKWGPQLNTLVNSQLQAAQEANLSAEQYRRVSNASEATDQ